MSCPSPTSIVSTLDLLRGNDQNLGLIVTNYDGSIYDLSGSLIVFTARENTYASQILFQRTGDIVSVPSGLAQLSFVPADTAPLGSREYYFDINLTASGGMITTLAYGILNVFPK